MSNEFDLVDIHFHGSFLDDASDYFQDLESSRVLPLCVGVDLEDFEECCKRKALGLHPWWVDSCSEEELNFKIAEFKRLSSAFKHFGEIGLDFSPKYEVSNNKQILVLEKLIQIIMDSDIVKSGFKSCVSLHSFKAEMCVIKILQKFDAFRKLNIIFHSFSGSQEALDRSTDLGAYFSFSLRNLKTKKIKDYIQKIPLVQLMIESDLPKEAHNNNLKANEYKEILEETLLDLYELRRNKDKIGFESFRFKISNNSILRLNGE